MLCIYLSKKSLKLIGRKIIFPILSFIKRLYLTSFAFLNLSSYEGETCFTGNEIFLFKGMASTNKNEEKLQNTFQLSYANCSKRDKWMKTNFT